MRIAIVASLSVLVSAAGTAHADGDDMVNWCASGAYQDPDGFVDADALNTEIAESDIPGDEKSGLAAQWSALRDANDRAGIDYVDVIQRCNDEKSLADGTRARIDAFNGSCSGSDVPESCADDESALRIEIAERHSVMLTLGQDIDAYSGRLTDLGTAVQVFLEVGRQTLARYFTGKRVFHVTAKSWIDGSAITEFSFRSLKLLLEQDDEPASPTSTGDYRLFQTFVVEVVYKQGKIQKARFVPASLQKDAGRTKVPSVGVGAGGLKIMLLRIKGRIYVVDQSVSISDDRESVVFTRTIEGHPSLVVLSLDKLVPFGQMGALPTIWNSLRLEVTANAVACTGDGSSFPSHRFWLGDEPCGVGSMGQVQPSEYFGVGE